MMCIRICFVMIGICLGLFGHGEGKVVLNEAPQIGSPCPNALLNNILDYPKKKVMISELKGKWLVLDFWSKYCSSCVASFPKINKMRKQFEGKVEFFLIGVEDKENMIRSMYRKYKGKENLEIPCVFDSSLAKKFSVQWFPYIVIVDANGIVRDITYSLKSEDVENYLQERDRIFGTFNVDEFKESYLFDFKKEFLINRNGGNDTDFLYRSVLKKWTNGMPRYLPIDIGELDTLGLFQCIGANLKWIYNYAFIGKPFWTPRDSEYLQYWPLPILKVKDSALFEFGNNVGWYSYSLSVASSKASRTYLMECVQSELKNIFRYNASVKVQEMPYLRLIIIHKRFANAILTKGRSPLFKEEIPRATFFVKNYPLSFILNHIWSYHQNSLPIVDETGIKGNIDLRLDCIMTDLDDIKKALNKNGLDLQLAKRMFKVIEISSEN